MHVKANFTHSSALNARSKLRPAILQKTFALPNLAIAPAPPPPEPAKPVMKVQIWRLAVRPVEKLARAPKVSLPVAESSAMPDLTAEEAPLPQRLRQNRSRGLRVGQTCQ